MKSFDTSRKADSSNHRTSVPSPKDFTHEIPIRLQLPIYMERRPSCLLAPVTLLDRSEIVLRQTEKLPEAEWIIRRSQASSRVARIVPMMSRSFAVPS